MSLFAECLVSLSDILFDDQSYRITTVNDKDDAFLRDSIAAVGLLTPPILQSTGSRGYRVVTGFRRLAALERLKITGTHCRLLDDRVEGLTCLKIAVADNAWQRPLNPVEQAAAIYKLSQIIGHPENLCRIAAALELPSTTHAVDNLLAVHSLPASVLDELAAGRLAFSTALSLTAVGEQRAIALARLLVDLKLGGNRQRTALTLITEISSAEDIPLDDLLAEINRQEVFNDPEADRGRRSETFFRYLQHRRFPHITAAKVAFADEVKTLKPGRRAVLTPPVNFEGAEYNLRLTFKNGEDIKQHIGLLERIAASDLIKKK